MIRRISQGLRALFAWATPVDTDAAAQILSPELMALFRRMRRSEQLHSLRVMRRLQAAGHSDPDLLAAALLHDCGKSRYPMTLVGRTLVVLVKRFLPGTYASLCQRPPRSWWRPFAVSAQHPEWSAEDMHAAGSSALAVSLARRHQTPLDTEPATEEDRLLSALQSADEQE